MPTKVIVTRKQLEARVAELEAQMADMAKYVGRLNREAIGNLEPAVFGRLVWRDGEWKLGGTAAAWKREQELIRLRTEAMKR
jgi:hypothetical protein